MNKYLLLLIIAQLIYFRLDAQTTLSGYVYDTQSREPLIGATLFDSLSQSGTTANEFGYYRLFLKNKAISLRVSYVGYQSQSIWLPPIQKDTIITILLDPSVSLKDRKSVV